MIPAQCPETKLCAYDLVSPDTAQHHWESCYRPLLKKAMDHSAVQFDTVGNLLKGILASEFVLMQISLDGELLAAAVHEIVEGRECYYLHVYAIGGEKMDVWLDGYIVALRAMAASLNCDKVSCSGRPGWIKALKQYGFKHEYSTLVMG